VDLPEEQQDIATKLKRFMRLVAQPVTVVTTKEEDKLIGLTLSSFTSISIKPPIVMICVSSTAPSLPMLLKREKFVVNLLSKGQQFLAERFSGIHNVKEKFDKIDYALNNRGLPVLSEAAAYIDCDFLTKYEAGDHIIILGSPVNISFPGKSDPLVYYAQQYCSVVNNSVLVLPEDYMIG
jgi:3-hydroxy-9,10-secoandrosta-1,3,5(10)-triene-9,17-dione monooxygenase reductase component